MPGKNSGICLGCRGVGHFFGGCPIKRRCPDCEHGFQKIFTVEKDTPNKGRFFKRCSRNCGFWEWCEEVEATSESSNTRVPLATQAAQTEVDNMSRTFETQLRLHNVEQLVFSVNVNVNVTVRHENPPSDRQTKGKGTA